MSLVNLYTAEGEVLSGQPWTTYPRPQLRRDTWLCLNGEWDFTVNDKASAPAVYDRTIRVPFCPESLLSGVGEVFPKGSVLHYRRAFTLPAGFHKGRVLLHVGAADQTAQVYLNGNLAGEHVGGYEPFSLDITAYLQAENTLEITVTDDLDSHVLPYGKQRRRRGGMWYTLVSGIWQTVWLESVPQEYVKALTVTADGEGATVAAEGVSEGVLTVTTPKGALTVPLTDGAARVEPHNPRLWCPDDPYLYEFTLTAGEDEVSSYFALRTLDTRMVDDHPRMCLNGKPVFFHGVLDQGYWSDGLFTPATPDGYVFDIEKMQELGFNTLRKHIKVEAERFYYECDRRGMLVWQDMVNNGRYSFLRDTALPTIGLKRLPDTWMHRNKRTRAAFVDGMMRTVAQLGNHPCIVGWTIFNEGWGQFDSEQMYLLLKQLDPDRFVDTASGWFSGADSDVVSHHVYFKPYRHRKGKKPVFLTEFGGYSYKSTGHVFNPDHTYGYRKYEDADKYMDDLERLYRTQIVPAAKEGLCGAIYTQLSDVEDETNGLYSYDRRVCKVDPERMKRIAAELPI